MLGKLSAIKIYPYFDAMISGPRERLHDRPISQHIGGDIDFPLCAVDQRYKVGEQLAGGKARPFASSRGNASAAVPYWSSAGGSKYCYSAD